MFARTESFEPIETAKFGEYDIIKGDLNKLLVATRGMKEVRLVITTVEGG